MQAVTLVKFFTPDSSWTRYATEFDGEDTFFGLVIGFEVELGYFTLSELREMSEALGFPVERISTSCLPGWSSWSGCTSSPYIPLELAVNCFPYVSPSLVCFVSGQTESK